MKMSGRAKRMERHHRRNQGHATITLVPMIDLLTVLVFFLLVNSTDSVLLQQSNKSIKLPESISQQKPEDTLVVQVTAKDIVVQGRRVATVDEVLGAPDEVIPGLKTELDYQSAKTKQALPAGKSFEGRVTIHADRQIRYELLKKVMVTCTNAEYGRISLAVVQGKES